MKAREIKSGISWMGSIDWERRMFDELIPLPDGTSYNAYLVRGSEKTALIDTADPAKSAALMAQLDEVDHLDYLIIQHVEQDHSGSAPLILEKYPNVQVISSPKAKPMIADHLGIPEDRIRAVEDGETLSLGNWTFEFIHAPWVHWPETMLTYLREEKVLFTCDLFGSHLATDKLFSGDGSHVCESAKRYYAEIMMPFSSLIKGHLTKLEPFDIDVIAPSHGPVHDEPSWILEAYHHWVHDEPKNLVVIPYTSMHGSTALMVDHLIEALSDRGVHVHSFHMSKTDLGEYAIQLVDASTVVFATPTVLVGPHPSIVLAAYLTAALRPKLKYAAVIGSYGWAGKAAEKTMDLCGTLKAEWMEPIFTKGLPSQETYKELDKLADEIAARHKGLQSGE
ncbi:FprA family A-type flavoprotein [Candidatus Bipolaricaulota bacterium]|nr:FprA family A-type flavoprotein [Candidatus Bipolaricaulota bacterium]TFH10771.1 MAG: FprA family A-type flavoprotein [Candidatus Atribacteria bacterium]